jgi:hypothetical protein
MTIKAGIALLMLLIVAPSNTAFAQTTSILPVTAKTLVERLGYPVDAKLLIVHSDDLGMTHSINNHSRFSFFCLQSGRRGTPAAQ